MRLRREPEMDPSTRRELEALDAALAGQPVDPRDEELASLAVALREERPLSRPEFALDLDLRVRDGFPVAETAQPRPRGRRGASGALGLALGTAASLFIVATAVLTTGVLDPGGDGSPAVLRSAIHQHAGRRRGGAAALQRGGGASAHPDIAPTAAPSERRVATSGAQTREMERAASLTLATPRDRIEDTADGSDQGHGSPRRLRDVLQRLGRARG